MTLEQKIADLNSANTHLVREVLGTKARAQVAADAAAQHAERSTAEATKAAQHKVDADRARSLADQAGAAAKHAENNAVAVVSGGTAASEPEAGKIPMADSEGLIANGWMLAVPSRAEFEARQETNRQLYAGSGFVDFGQHRKNTTVAFGDPINEGMWAYASQPNNLRLGVAVGATKVEGKSQRRNPLVNVNGVLINVEGVGMGSGDHNKIMFPEAPAATNKIKNGDFLIASDLAGWAPVGPEWSLSSEGLSIDGTQSAESLLRQQINGIEKGEGLLAEYEVEVASGTIRFNQNLDGETNEAASTQNGVHQVEFVALNTEPEVQLRISADFVGKIKRFSVIQKKGVSRADLVFLEVWHESISDKDVVYPFGNVQFGGGNAYGVDLTGSLVAQGYSAFGEWDSTTKGNAARWSGLTAAQKQAFIDDPLNNIYSDDGELVQVRYRVRVEEGRTASWEFKEYGFRSISDMRIRAQGAAVSYPKTGSANANTYRTTANRLKLDRAASSACIYSPLNTLNARNGQCYAIPIVSVVRRNQGVYHNVFNPLGSDRIGKEDGWGALFYQKDQIVSDHIRSTMDCFSKRPANEDYGDLATPYSSGRIDKKFHNAIYANDVIDLRMNASVSDAKRLLANSVKSAIAGDIRGEENPLRIVAMWPITSSYAWSGRQVIRATGAGGAELGSSPKSGYIAVYSTGVQYLNYYAWDGVEDRHQYQIEAEHMDVSLGVGDHPNSGWLVKVEDMEGQVSGGIMCCDIIGDPANYPEEWKKHGVFGTPLLVHPDTGESLIPDGTPKEFKMSRKVRDVRLVLYTSDRGNTWHTSSAWTANLKKAGNSHSASPSAGVIHLVFYTAEANGWEVTDNASAIALGDIWSMAEDGTTTHLANHLIGKTPDSLASYGLSFASAPLQRYAQNMHNSYLNKIGQQPEYQPLDIDPGNAGVALKVLPYLAEDKGRAYLHMLFKELRHDGTDWGDDARFKVVDGVSTMTDDNGKTVLVGQKRIPLPYFLKSEV